MANRYWVGGTGTWNTTSTANWSASSGGTGGASIPTANDSVFFNQAGTYTVTMTNTLACLDITTSTGTVTFATGTNPSLTVSGSMTLSAGTVWNSTGAITFNATSSKTITTNSTLITPNITFNGVGGTWTLGSALTTDSGAVTTLLNGTLNLSGFTLTTGIFSSSNTNTRAINFGAGNIAITTTTPGVTALLMTTATNFTWTGTGGFTAAANVVRTFTFGTTGGSSTNSPNLTFTTGTAIPIITTGSWFNTLDFGTTAFTLAATSLNLDGLTLSSGGTFTNLTATLVGTGTIISNTNTTLPTLTINHNGTTTLGDAFATTSTGTITLTAGTINLGGYDLTTGIFSSTNTNTRSIAFGTNNIVLVHTTAATTVLSMATATGFTNTGTGGFAAAANITRTFTFGTTGGTTSNAPNLYITSGASIPAITSGSYFNKLDFTGSTCAPSSTSLNLNSLTLASGASYVGLTATMVGTGTVISNGNTTLLNMIINSSGTTSLGDALILAGASTAVGNMQITAGTLSLNGFDLTCNRFILIGSGASAISFSSNNIVLASANAGAVVMQMVDMTNFSYTGTGGFTTTAAVTRTFSVGSTAGGTTSNAPNLTLTGAGASALTITSTSWFKSIDFGTTTSTVTGTANIVNNLILASGGTYTGLSINLVGTGTVTPTGKTIAALVVNNGAGTTTLAGALICTTYTQTAGTIDFATNNLTCSGAAVYTAGTLSNISTISCTTWTISAGSTFTLTSGTISASTSFTLTSGSFNYNGGTITTPSFIHTAGTVSMSATFTLPVTCTYTLTAGSLLLGGYDLSVGIFSSSNTNVRAISFGTNTISLTFTTSSTTVLSMATVTSFTYTGLGGFTAATDLLRTYTFGTTGGSATNSPNLTFTGSGVQAPTLTTGSWFNTLNFNQPTGAAYTVPTTSLNLTNLILSANGNFANLTAVMVATGTITPTNNGSLGNLTINGVGITTSLAGALTLDNVATGITTLTNGTLNLNGFNLTTNTFSSSNTNTRSITFGSNNITLRTTTVSAINLDMATATNFSWTGTGKFTADANVARTYTFGTTGGSATNSPNLTITSGSITQTFTTGSWFNNLEFSASVLSLSIPVTSLNLNGLILTGTGNFFQITVILVGTGTIAGNGKSIAALTVNHAGTTTFSSALGCTTYTQTAGNVDFATFNLTGSGAATYTAGTLSNIGTISCTTWTIAAGSTFTMNSGTITASTSFTLTSGAFNYNGGTGVITTPSFVHTAGTVTLGASLTLPVTGTYTLTAGTLNLGGYNLSVGAFSSSNTNTRSITFGTNNIILTAASGTVLSMATATGFTYTGTGGFTSDASVVRTFTFGTTGGSITNSPNLTFTGSGTAIPVLTTASWFNTLDFGTTAFTLAATSLNLRGLTLSSGGTFTAMTVTLLSTGTVAGNGKSIAALTINHAGTTTFSSSMGCTTYTQTAGNVDFATFNLTGSGAVTYTAGTLSNIGTISCTTWTIAAASTFTMTSGTITASTSFTLTSGAFNYNGGTGVITTPSFIHTAGTVTIGAALTLTGTYTLTAGTLTLSGYDLSVGVFSSSNLNARAITFGTNNIILTAASGTVLSMADTAGCTITATTGGFTSDASVVRTFTVGTVSAASVVPNLTFTGSGTAIPVLTTGSFFNKLDFGTTAFTLAITTLNLRGGLTLSSGGTFTNLTVNMIGTGTITPNGKTIAAFTVNNAGGFTTTLAGALGCTTYTQTSGAIDFATYNLTCSSTVTYTAGTLSNIGTISCTTWTVNTGGTFTLTQGTITPSVSFVVLAATSTFNYNGGTLSPVPTFTQTAGTVTLNQAYALTATGAYTLTAGTLTLNGGNLTTGEFNSNSANTRSIAFGSNNIILTTTTAGSSNIGMATVTGFTWTGTGGFTAAADITRFFTFGNIAGGTAANSINLTFTGSGTAVQTLTSASWFRTVDFGTTAFTLAVTTLNLSNLTLSSGGTFSNLTATMVGTGTLSGNSKTISALTINGTGITTTLSTTLTVSGTTTLTAGTLALNAGLTTGIFGTAGAVARSVAFGTNNIVLNAASGTVLSMAVMGGFTYTGTGGFTADASVVRTYSVGSTSGGTTTNAPNLTFTGSGTAIPVLTTAGTFGKLDFGTTAFTLAATTLSMNSLTLGSGTYTNLSATFFGTGTITPNGKSIAALTVNTSGTVTLAGALGCTTYVQTGGTTDFATFNLTASSSLVYQSATSVWTNIGTISGTTLNIQANGVLTLTSGTITPSVAVVVQATATFNYNGGTLSPVPTFTHTAGTVSFGKDYALTATGTYTFTAGTLTLNGFNLTTGIFSSTGTGVRSINFGTNNIILAHTTAATTVLSMADATNFTRTATTGGFAAAANITRTFTFGTTAGSVSNAPNLAITSGSAVTTFTDGSWFNILDFTGSSNTPAVTASNLGLNINTLTLDTGGTYTSLVPVFTRTQSWTPQFSKPLGGIGFNLAGGTLTLDNTQTYTATAQFLLVQGTLGLSSDLTFGVFNSNNSNIRSISFGSNNIILATTTAAATNLNMANATNFTYTGTGGFNVAADITRTLTFGTTGGSATNAPNLTFTGSGTAVVTLTTGSWFNVLNFGTTGYIFPAASINLQSVTLSASGTFTAFSIVTVGAGSITSNGKPISTLQVNNAGGFTTTLVGPLTFGTATASVTLSTGTLDLNGNNLTVGTFTSNTTNTRSIIFGSNNIILATTSAGATVLSITNATGFSYTGTGGFVSDASITRTYTFGTTAGSITNAPNLTLTGSGTAIQTITTGSWFNTLNFGTTAFAIPTTTVNVINITLSSGGTYTALTINMVGTGTITTNGKSIAGLTVSTTGTTTLGGAVTLPTTSVTTLTTGTLNLNGFDLTTGTFSSNNANVRSILFGSGNIILTTATAATLNLDMATITNFTWTGTGGFRAAADITRTFTVGSTAGDATSAPNLSLISGAAVPTFTNGSWFKALNFTGTTSTPAVTASTLGIYVDTLTLATGGTYTNLIPVFTRTQTWTSQFSKQLGGIGVNGSGVTLTLDNTQTYTATSTCILTQGTLDLGASNQTFGTFSSNNANTRSIVFGSNNIVLATTTSAATALNMVDATNFTYTGTGGFTAAADVIRTYTFGTTGGSATNSPNLTFTGTGTIIPVLTTGSWFNTLSFGTTVFALAATSLNLNSLTLSSSGTFTGLTANMRGTGTITGNKPLAALAINSTGTTTLANALSTIDGGSISLTAGTLDLANFTLTCGGVFSSSNSTTRTIIFGTGNIALTYTVATIHLSMSVATNFTYTGTGGFTAIMSVSRGFRFGSGGGGSTTNAPNLTLTSGASEALITSGSSFNTFNCSGSTSTISGSTAGSSTTINVINLTLSTTSGNYSNLTANMVATGTIQGNSRAISTLTIDHSGTTTISSALAVYNTTTLGITSTPTLALNGVDLTTGFFSSSGILARTITFGYNFIVTTVSGVSIADATNFTWTGTGGFRGSMGNQQNFQFGPTGASASNAPNLFIYSGASAATITSNSWFSKIDCTGSTGIVGTTSTTAAVIVNVNNLILASGANATTAYGWMQANMFGVSSTISGNGKSIYTFTIPDGGTTTLASALGCLALYTQVTNTTLNLATFTLTASAGFAYNDGTISNFGTIATTAFTLNGPTLTLSAGSITCSSSFTTTAGSFTLSGTGTLSTPTFQQTAGNVTFGKNFTLLTDGSYTLSSGALDLGGFTLTTGLFSSNTTSVRSIAFGTGTIAVNYSVGGAIAISMGNLTNFTYTGTGGFTCNMNISRRFRVGYAGGNTGTNAPNITLTGSFEALIDTGAWFNTFNCSGSTSTISGSTTGTSTTINVINLTLGTAGGSYINVTANMVATGTIIGNSRTIGALTIDHPGTTTISSALAVSNTTTLGIVSTPTLALNAVDLTTGFFSSSGILARTITFGANFIVTTVSGVSIADATNFTWTGTGGFRGSMGNQQNFQFGPTGATEANAIDLYLYTGASAATLSTNSYFNKVDCTGGTGIVGTTSTATVRPVNFKTLILSSGANATTAYGWLQANMYGTSSTINGNGKSIYTFTIPSGGTTTLASALGCLALYTQVTNTTLNLAGFTLTASAGFTYNDGTINNFGTISTTTFTLNGPTLTLNSGAINCSSSFIINSGSFTLGASGSLGATPAFSQVAGNVTFGKNYALSADGTYTLTAGVLDLTNGGLSSGFTLTTGVFSSSGSTIRSIAFGTGNIAINYSVSGGIAISMPAITNFTYTGTGGFTCNMNVSRRFRIGSSSGGSTTTAPNFTLTGAFEALIDSGAWFNTFNCSGSTSQIAGSSTGTSTTLNVINLTLSATSGNYSNVTANMIATGTIIGNSRSISTLTIDHAGTTTLSSTIFVNNTTTLGITSTPTLVLNAVDLTTGFFSSSGILARTITFGANFIVTTVSGVSIADATNFTWTGTGGFRGSMGNQQNFQFGPTGASASNAPNLFIYSGASAAIITTGSWFSKIDCTGSTGIVGTTSTSTPVIVNVNNLILASGANATTAYGWMQANMFGTTSTINGNGKSIYTFTIPSGGTTTLASALGCVNGLYTQAADTTLNLAGFTLTASAGFTYNGGTISNFGTISTTTFTLNGPTLTLNSGAINCSSSFVINSGSFTLGALGSLGATPTFSQVAGNVTFGKNYALSADGTYILTAGVLDLGGFTLTTGVFSSSGSTTRSILFGSGNIAINYSVSSGIAISMPAITNFTWTGTGGFTCNMNIPRRFRIGNSSGGSSSNAPNLSLTGGAGEALIDTGAWINTFNCTGGTSQIAGSSTGTSTTLNVNSLTLATGGSYTLITVNVVGTGTITCTGKTIPILTINHTGTTTLAGTLNCGTYTQTAGDVNFATNNLACTGAIAYTSGIYTNTGTITCTTFTVTGAFTLSNGTLTPSVNFTLSSGSFNYTGGTLSALPAFIQSAGTVTISKAYALTATGTYTLTSGDLILNGFDLTTGIFNSNNTNIRSINFGTNNIILAHTTAATINLEISNATNFTSTGTGGFTAAANITRTFQFGTTGGSALYSPNLTLTGSGTAIQTFTTGSWFNILNFGTTAFAVPATSLNLNGFTLSSGGTFTSLATNMSGTGTATSNAKTISTFTVNTIGTTTLGGNLTCSSYVQTSGILNFNGFTINSIGAASASGGTLVNATTITCTSFTVSTGTFVLDSGTINTTTFIITSGTFNYNGGTLSSVTNFTHTAGTVNLGANLTLATTSTYTFTAGTLNLAGFNLTIGIFSSSNVNTRSIGFGTGNIALVHPTAAQTVLAIADATNFNYTGTTGGFTAAADVTRTFTFGTSAGGSFYNAPNLSITSGSAIATLTTNSWFKSLNFTGSTTTPAVATLNVDTLTLASGGTYTNIVPQFTRTQTWTSQFSKVLGGIGVNGLFQTLTLDGTQTYTATSVCNLVAGILNLGGFDLTVGAFNSSGTTNRLIVFVNNNIILASTTAATTVLSVADATNFSFSSVTGGFVSDASITRTYTFGTTGGSTFNAPNLLINSGTAIPTLTTGSWFGKLDFTGADCVPAVTTLNLTSVTLSSGGTFTNLSATMRSNGVITPNGKAIAALVINHTDAGTTTLAGALTCTTQTYLLGNVDFGNFNLTSSGAAAYSSGVFSNINIITCTTFTITGAFALSQGTITPSTSFILTSGSLTYTGGTLSPVATFTHTAGTLVLGKDYIVNTATGTYAFNGGSIVLNGYNLTVGIFSSTGIISRSISFTTGNIVLAHTTAGTTVLSMADVTNFTQTATTGGFTTSASITKTFTFGTTSGSVSNAPNLYITSGVAVTTFTDGSWFKTLDFTGSSNTPAVTASVLGINIDTLVLATGGTYTSLIPVFTRTQTWTSQFSKQLGGIGFNLFGGTLTLDNTQTYTATSQCILTQGTLNLGGVDQTFGVFSSNNANIRSITFGSNNIVLSTTTAAATNINMATATNFTYTGTGGFTAPASITRTFTFGTTGGSITNSLNLTFTGSGTAVQTLTTGSWFKTLDFGSTGFTIAATNLNLANLILSSAGTYTNLTATMVATGTVTGNTKPVGALTISNSGTTTININTTVSGATTIILGILDVATYGLTTGTFVSSGTSTRSIIFGSSNIVLSTTTAAATNINIVDATGFSYTGTGGFTAPASITRTFTFGTTGGSITNSINLTFTGSGTAVQTLTTGSWFNKLDFGSTVFNPGTTSLNLNSLTLSSTGTFTTLTANMVGTGTIISNGNSTLAALNINSSGTTTLGSAFTLSATSNTALILGNLDLGGFTLTTGAFNSSNTGVRSIIFGTSNIVLAHTTAATVVLSMADVTNFTYTGTGGFTSNMSTTRTFRFGSTAGGSTTNAPNLALTAGASIPTLTTNSWFKVLDFTGSTSTPAIATLNVDTLTLDTGGTYTNLIPQFTRTQTWTSQFSKQLGGIGVNGSGVTLTLDNTQTYTATSVCNIVEGTLNLGGYDLTIGTVSSSNTTTRAIAFGSNNIVLSTTTAAATNLSMAIATGFTWTGTGGFTAAADITRTFTFGTTGGSITNSPNLTFTGSGTAVQTLTTGSWFKTLNFGTTAFNPGTTSLNLTNLTLSSGGVFTGLTATMVDTGTVTSNTNVTLLNLVINGVGITTSLADALVTLPTGITTLTNGILDLNGFDLVTDRFDSSGTGVRSVAFGTNSIKMGYLAYQAAVPLFVETVYTASSSYVVPTGMTSIDAVCVATGVSGIQTAAGAGGGLRYITGAPVTAGNTITINVGGTSSLVRVGTGILVSVGSGATGTAIGAGPFGGTIGGGSGGSGGSSSSFGSGGGGAGGYSGNGGSGGSGNSAGVTGNTGGGGGGGSADSTLTGGGGGGVGLYGVGASGGGGSSGSNVTNGNQGFGGSGGGGGGGPVTSGGSFGGGGGGRATSSGGSGAGGAVRIMGGFSRSFPSNAPNYTVSSTPLTMADVTNFTYTGSGGFVLDAEAAKTVTFGTTGGLTTNSVNLTYIGSGTGIQTITTGSWFKTLDFGTTAFAIPLTTLNVTNLTLSSGGTYTSLTPTMVATGTITPNGKTVNNLTINHTGTTTLAGAFGTTALNTTTLTQGTFDLAGFSYTTGIFSSTNSNTRSLAFGSGSITLTSGSAVTALSMATATGFTWTGTGGFISNQTVARTFSFGSTAGGSVTNAPNLSLSGTAQSTLTVGSWFDLLDFTGSTFAVPATTINVDTLFLSSTGTYTSFIPVFTRTQTWTSQFSRQLGGIGVNGDNITLTLDSTQTYTATSQLVVTTGTVDLGGSDLTIGTVTSNNTNSRAISFGSNNIILATTTAGATNIDIANATNFSSIGTGGFRAAADITRTFTFGSTAGGSVSNAPNLSLTSGASIITFTSGSWFKELNFTGTTSSLTTTTINVDTLTLATGGTYTGLIPVFTRTQTWTPQFSKILAGIGVNGTGETLTLENTQTYITLSTLIVNAGALDLNGLAVLFNDFTSTSTGSRSITGNGIITISNNWTVTSGSGFTGSDYTIRMSKPTPKTFAGGGGSYGTLIQYDVGTLTVTGSNTFVDIQLDAVTNPVGQIEYTTPGTYLWQVPANVTSVCVVAVGAGGGGFWNNANNGGSASGGGGGLGWKNNISVAPGQSYTVVVGQSYAAPSVLVPPTNDGQPSYFINISTVAGLGGGRASSVTSAGAGGGYVGDGGGNGGNGAPHSGGNAYSAPGGGGAGGYAGTGGSGVIGTNNDGAAGTNGSGGGGGGGGGTGGTYRGPSTVVAASGGGVGIYGQGASGTGGAAQNSGSSGTYANYGTGGSGGGNGASSQVAFNAAGATPVGGLYGGGGGGGVLGPSAIGAGGAVRIIWGIGRAFPSTNTGNL